MVRTYDFDFEDDNSNKPTAVQNTNKEENYDFGNVNSSYHPLLKFYAINRYFSLKQALIDYGCEVRTTNMFCPFHEDELTGKPSARYHEDSDLLYCFSESKIYSAYHALKILHGANMDEKFLEAWSNLDDMEKQELIIKYDNGGDSYNSGENEFINPIWGYHKPITEMFSQKKVSFKQHKNALYKIFYIMFEKDTKVKLKQLEDTRGEL